MTMKLPILPFISLLLVSCGVVVPEKPQDGNEYSPYNITTSNTTIDCKGEIFNEGKLTKIVIHSPQERLENIKIQNCIIKGGIRIYGLGLTGKDEKVRTSSRMLGHTERVQAAAPTKIVISNNKIEETGDIPIYISPGVVDATIEENEFSGQSNSTAIYLAGESARNRILNNTFNILTQRETIAVDGSAGNIISNNKFNLVPYGGIYLYRNCGEDGTIRHQSPQFNTIENNTFNLMNLTPGNYGVWLGSRNGNRSYCEDDAGFPFGSSANNSDYASFNSVKNNVFIGSIQTIKDDSGANEIK